jgi:hypothetical protein
MKTLNQLNNIADTVKIPTGAQYYRMNPTNEFIEQFYKIENERVFYYSIFNEWNVSEAAEKQRDFVEKKLIKLITNPNFHVFTSTPMS